MKWITTFKNRGYKCTLCGYCCSCENWRIYLNYFDFIRLKDYKYAIEECNNFFKYRTKINSRGCILLENNLCKIHLEKGYEYKPLMCRIFPYSLMVKWDGSPLLIIKHYCKGIIRKTPNKKELNNVKNLIKELYFDSFEKFLEEGMENNSKTKLFNDTYILWEERDEWGEYIFNSSSFLEIIEKCNEIFGSKFNINIYKSNNENEHIIIEYLYELNRREHFRKLSFYNEVRLLLNIGNYLKKCNNQIIGEREIDYKLFFKPNELITYFLPNLKIP